jgi:flagellar biogenesis protein FliO
LLNSTAGNQDNLLAKFYDNAQQAYQNMFLFAVVISGLIFMGGWLVRRLLNQNRHEIG